MANPLPVKLQDEFAKNKQLMVFYSEEYSDIQHGGIIICIHRHANSDHKYIISLVDPLNLLDRIIPDHTITIRPNRFSAERSQHIFIFADEALKFLENKLSRHQTAITEYLNLIALLKRSLYEFTQSEYRYS